MNTAAEVLAELKKKGSAQTLRIFARHGTPAKNMYGVKVGDMKVILKKIRGNQQLAMDLYATGNGDAQYLAGLAADGAKMSKKELETWAKTASWQMVSEYSVPWVASENPAGRELAMKWIKGKDPHLAAIGWATYASILSTHADETLDLAEIEGLLDSAVKNVHSASPRVAYTMNNFVIVTGCYVKPLLAKAKAAAKKIGPVEIDMGDTSCKVPFAADYIAKAEKMGRIGKKRADVRC
jgi:3-methyladenine DNA glycosylase AlkD